MLDDACRFEEVLLRATGQTFCQITAANADRIALTNAIRRTYREASDMTNQNTRGARGNEALPTWPVHDAALAVLPVLVRADLHLRRLAGQQADALAPPAAAVRNADRHRRRCRNL